MHGVSGNIHLPGFQVFKLGNKLALTVELTPGNTATLSVRSCPDLLQLNTNEIYMFDQCPHLFTADL